MERLQFSDHAKRRMRERKIAKIVVELVVWKATYRYVDSATRYTVFVKRIVFAGKDRFIAVSAEHTGGGWTIVSVHPVRDRDVVSRVASGRWYEKKDKRTL